VIISGKFGDRQAERNRTVPVFAAPGRRVNGAALLHSRRLTRASLPAFLPSPLSVSGKLGSDRIAVSVRGPRVGHRELRTPLSNRELDLLERHLSHCKQRKATVSNRELSTVCDAPNIVNLVRFSISKSPSRAPISDANFRQLTTFLPGSGRKVEVTEKKRLNPVYRALEMHINALQFRAEFRTESKALREKECRSRDAAEQGKLPLHTRNAKELL
jgi:hypothetical protein